MASNLTRIAIFLTFCAISTPADAATFMPGGMGGQRGGGGFGGGQGQDNKKKSGGLDRDQDNDGGGSQGNNTDQPDDTPPNGGGQDNGGGLPNHGNDQGQGDSRQEVPPADESDWTEAFAAAGFTITKSGNTYILYLPAGEEENAGNSGPGMGGGALGGGGRMGAGAGMAPDDEFLFGVDSYLESGNTTTVNVTNYTFTSNGTEIASGDAATMTLVADGANSTLDIFGSDEFSASYSGGAGNWSQDQITPPGGQGNACLSTFAENDFVITDNGGEFYSEFTFWGDPLGWGPVSTTYVIEGMAGTCTQDGFQTYQDVLGYELKIMLPPGWGDPLTVASGDSLQIQMDTSNPLSAAMSWVDLENEEYADWGGLMWPFFQDAEGLWWIDFSGFFGGGAPTTNDDVKNHPGSYWPRSKGAPQCQYSVCDITEKSFAWGRERCKFHPTTDVVFNEWTYNGECKKKSSSNNNGGSNGGFGGLGGINLQRHQESLFSATSVVTEKIFQCQVWDRNRSEEEDPILTEDPVDYGRPNRTPAAPKRRYVETDRGPVYENEPIFGPEEVLPIETAGPAPATYAATKYSRILADSSASKTTEQAASNESETPAPSSNNLRPVSDSFEELVHEAPIEEFNGIEESSGATATTEQIRLAEAIAATGLAGTGLRTSLPARAVDAAFEKAPSLTELIEENGIFWTHFLVLGIGLGFLALFLLRKGEERAMHTAIRALPPLAPVYEAVVVASPAQIEKQEKEEFQALESTLDFLFTDVMDDASLALQVAKTNRVHNRSMQVVAAPEVPERIQARARTAQVEELTVCN